MQIPLPALAAVIAARVPQSNEAQAIARENETVGYNAFKGNSVCVQIVDKHCDAVRNEALDDRLTEYEQRSQPCCRFEFPYARVKSFQHKTILSYSR